MNKDQWKNFKSLVSAGVHICMSIADFTDILKNHKESNVLGFDPITDREILRSGLYGYFRNGQVVICVSNDTPAGYFKCIVSGSRPTDNKSSEWSEPMPIELISSLDEINRLAGLKAFW